MSNSNTIVCDNIESIILNHENKLLKKEIKYKNSSV